MKSKIQDLETRVNTLSWAGDDSRIDEKQRYEKLLNKLNDENNLITEKYSILQ